MRARARDRIRTSPISSPATRALGLSRAIARALIPRAPSSFASPRRARTHHERIVKRRIDVRDAEHEFAFARLRPDVIRHRAKVARRAEARARVVPNARVPDRPTPETDRRTVCSYARSPAKTDLPDRRPRARRHVMTRARRTDALGRSSSALARRRRARTFASFVVVAACIAFARDVRARARESDVKARARDVTARAKDVRARARALTLSTHGALMTFDVDTRRSAIVHEGRGVYYGIFPADDVDASGRASDGRRAGRFAYVASRPDNAWKSSLKTESHEDSLLLIDLLSGELIRERALDAKFTHDVVRRGSQVFAADTGGGRVLELEYPSMRLKYAVKVGVRQHVNTIAPADVEEYGEHTVWAVLHNLGPSKLVLIDLEHGRVLKTLSNVGIKSHGCVPYEGGFLMLNSGEGMLIKVYLNDKNFDVLWTDPKHTFMKGLAVIDDVAYFGVSEFGERDERADPSKTSDVVAFDLASRTVLWRETVATRGLLNIIAAPMLDEASTWKPISWTRKEDPRPALDTDEDLLMKDVDADEDLLMKDVDADDVNDSVYASWIHLSHKEQAESKRLEKEDMLLIYKRIDVKDLQLYISSLPPDAFKLASQSDNARLGGRTDNMEMFKPNVDTMILIFSDRTGRESYIFPYWEKFKPFVTPILENLFNKQLGIEGDPVDHIIRLQFAVMNPDSEIKKHVDKGGWSRHYHRFHVPIFVPDKLAATEFTMGPVGQDTVDVPLSEGLPFEINNGVPHWVKNTADTWRIHLLIDFDEQPVPHEHRHELRPGQMCDYSKLDVGCLS